MSMSYKEYIDIFSDFIKLVVMALSDVDFSTLLGCSFPTPLLFLLSKGTL